VANPGVQRRDGAVEGSETLEASYSITSGFRPPPTRQVCRYEPDA
jgi:hypothetical protein